MKRRSDDRTPSERAMSAKLASHVSWSQTPDRTARTEPGRQALLAKFEQQVDPDGAMTPEARRDAALSARKAHFARMALRSAQSRRRAAAQRQAKRAS